MGKAFLILKNNKKVVKMKIKELKKGDFFTKKSIEYPKENQVFIRGDYDRSLKKFEIIRFSDCNDVQFISGEKEIFVDFIF